MSLDKNVIKIARLHKKSKVSVLLLVENGDFSSKQILQADSKTEKGKVIEKVEEIPPNLFDLIVAFFLLIPLVGAGAWAGYIFSETKSIETDSIKDEQSKKEERLLEAWKQFNDNNIYYVSDKYKKLVGLI